MNALYIESSAILTWLFGEPEFRKVVSLINSSETIVTSVLSIVETERTLLRTEHQQIIIPNAASLQYFQQY
ncbi:MAG: PIN domain-containing protein [Candidatus Anammoxibacter sp.]